MTDREKVIKGLECCKEGYCPACPYYYETKEGACQMHDDAIALLKEQEARVLTLEEVVKHEWDFVYVEKERRAYSKEVEAFCGKYRVHCTTSVALERQSFGDSEYNKTWRCWSACPTDEQRKAVKWDE